MSELFIPKKIKVGYQERNDTYTKRLAYVIYYDNKGKLRKETSWEGWRDKKIAAEEFDNTPQSGFVLNKGVQRCNWSHFSSNRSYIRIYDERGIEFEITPDNLIAILMETTCSKRGLDGEFVYAWDGKDLLLLPCSSEAYQQAKVFTERQDQKVSAKELKPGCSYTTKQGEEVIYMGRFNWFEWKGYGDTRVCKKSHIFCPMASPEYGKQEFYPKPDVSFLASLNNPDPVGNYAELMEKFSGDIHSSVITGFDVKPLKPTSICRESYCKMMDGYIQFYDVEKIQDHGTYVNNRYVYETKGYVIHKSGRLDTKTFSRKSESYNRHYYWRYSTDRKSILSQEQCLAELAKLDEIHMILESGKKLLVKGLHDHGD